MTTAILLTLGFVIATAIYFLFVVKRLEQKNLEVLDEIRAAITAAKTY